MKLALQWILMFACCGFLGAQTNAPPAGPAATNADLSGEAAEEAVTAEAPEPIETHIYSDTFEFPFKARTAIYRGNVRLDDPRIHLTCEQLTSDVPSEGSRVTRVVAETNVVIVVVDEKGLTNRAYADRAVYTYEVTESLTNEVVELFGETEQPHIERPEGVLYGNPITWDRTKNTLRAKNQRMIHYPASTNQTHAVPPVQSGTPEDETAVGSDSPGGENPAPVEATPDE